MQTPSALLAKLKGISQHPSQMFSSHPALHLGTSKEISKVLGKSHSHSAVPTAPRSTLPAHLRWHHHQAYISVTVDVTPPGHRGGKRNEIDRLETSFRLLGGEGI